MSLRRLLLLTCACLPGCVGWSSRENVLVSSDPLGARIHVDGTDTGLTTPAVVTVGGNYGTDHTIELHKQGYRPARRRVYQFNEGYTSKWIDGAFDMALPPLPLFWTLGDFFLPFAIRGALLPSELYVRLERDDAPLLGFDLLAARAAAAERAP